MSDPRFNSANFDPIFSKKSKNHGKIKVDDRFKAVLTDDRFSSIGNGNVDKYGRKIKKDNKKAIKELSEFYEIDDNDDGDNDDDEDEEDDDKIEKKTSSKAKPKNEKEMETRLEYLNRLARGDVDDDEDEDDDDDSDDDNDNDNNDIVNDKHHSILDIDEEEAIDMGDATSRLAIQNCDWENVKADDILMVLQSFCPQGKVVKSVNIYPSDYGIKCMAAEAKYGPQGIWKVKQHDDDDDDESDDDMYDGIDGINDDDDDDDYEQQSKKGKTEKGVEFKRRNGTVGIVLQDDLVRKGKAKADDNNHKNNNDGGGIDIVALRKYELSKLRYYFAIAECDSIDTANHLYDQLDMIEFGHSSMTFDLRFVPDDVNFNQRQIKDSCTKISLDYKPTEFVVNALQHTDVQCTWDDGEKEREHKLTNISQWRQLNESDFQQYIASSDSDSDDDKNRAKNIRKLLIGNTGDDSDDDDDDDDDDVEKDDFFTKASDDDEEEGAMEYTYVPGMGKELLQRKKDAKEETPAEATRRKYLEKKKERKLAKKLKISKQNDQNDDDNDDDNDNDDDDDNIVENNTKTTNTKRKNKNNTSTTTANDLEPSANSAELELLFADDDDNKNDYDMRAIVKQEKTKNKKKNKKSIDTANSDEFKLNTEDPRFSKLFEGDSRFGIDRTANEFKETPSMRTIFDVQRKKRNDKTRDSNNNHNNTNDDSMDTNNTTDVSNLVNKLKRKFQK